MSNKTSFEFKHGNKSFAIPDVDRAVKDPSFHPVNEQVKLAFINHLKYGDIMKLQRGTEWLVGRVTNHNLGNLNVLAHSKNGLRLTGYSNPSDCCEINIFRLDSTGCFSDTVTIQNKFEYPTFMNSVGKEFGIVNLQNGLEKGLIVVKKIRRNLLPSDFATGDLLLIELCTCKDIGNLVYCISSYDVNEGLYGWRFTKDTALPPIKMRLCDGDSEPLSKDIYKYDFATGTWSNEVESELFDTGE